ncbi:MAG TPA: hypothetical protein ENJ82_09155, partial [Bacteroidetes bacterium]|nr:hypothetical protein [Bacteroidota bacterium]
MKINLPRTPLSLILVALLSLITWESCRNRPTEDGTLAFHQNFPGDKIPVFEMKYGDRRINEISISRNGKDGWAVGNSGIIKFWNGNKWVLHEQGSAVTNLDLLVLFVLEDQNEAWAFGRKGVCLSYKDGNWKIDEQLSSMSGHDWNGCWFNPAGTHGLVVGNYGQILQLIDGKWSLYHNEKLLSQKLAIISYLDLEEVEVSESMNEGWIVGKSGMILKVSGPVWDIQVYQGGTPSAHLWDVKLSRDGKIGWISGEGGVILRKNGVNWETFGKGTQLPNQRLTTISFTKDGHQVWVAGSHNTLISIKGDKWKQVSAKGMARRSNLFYASDWNESTKQLWLGGEGGQMVVIDKDGIWTEYGDLLLGTAAVICKIRMSEDNSRGWAVGRDGDILAYKFGKWSEVKHSFPKLWYQGLWVNKVGTRGWAVGSDGVVLSMNEGEWTIDSMASGLCKKQLNAVWMRDDLSKGVIVGDAGAVLEYYAGAWHDKSDSLVAKLDFSAADLWINEMGTK